MEPPRTSADLTVRWTWLSRAVAGVSLAAVVPAGPQLWAWVGNPDHFRTGSVGALLAVTIGFYLIVVGLPLAAMIEHRVESRSLRWPGSLSLYLVVGTASGLLVWILGVRPQGAGSALAAFGVTVAAAVTVWVGARLGGRARALRAILPFAAIAAHVLVWVGVLSG